MNILALDIAAKTGWACMVDGKVESGVFDVSEKDFGEAGYLFGNWIADTLTRVGKLVIEMPISWQRNLTAARCDGLYMIAQAAAHAQEIPREDVTAAKWRKAILGRGNLPRAEAKRLVLIWAHTSGFKPVDDNEAEALAILTWALEKQAEAA